MRDKITGKNLSWKWPAVFAWALALILFSGYWSTPLRAQVGIDFNRGDNSGSLNLTASYRMYHDISELIPKGESSLHLSLNGFFWLGGNLSTRFTLAAGLPLLAGEGIDSAVAAQVRYFYEGDFALRFNLLKSNSIALLLGPLIDISEGHSGNVFLFNPRATSNYLQTGLGLEFEMAFALGLEYLFYFRLKVPFSTYNYILGRSLEWGFYPRQGSLELAFLFHKGPSFGVSQAARNIYFGPYYRFEARVLSLSPPSLILSHTIGVSYYLKPPF